MPAVRRGEGDAGVTNLELFYDLVYVFAVTQVSHLLLAHLSWEGAGQAAIVLLAVWWSWNFTTWAANEVDPESAPVGALVIALMLLGLSMAIAIPHAFAGEALLFAASYVLINLGRSAFMSTVGGAAGSEARRLGRDQLLWFGSSSVLWIAGAALDGTPRAICWIVAVLWDSAGPLRGFRLPGMPRLASAQRIGAEHLSERYRLFVLIALGESIVITGSTASGLHIDAGRAAAFVLTFAVAVELWWLYFARIVTIARARLSEPDGTTLARDLFTYLHAPLIAGIVTSAVGNQLVIAHPTDPLHGAKAVAVVAGPFLYLLAQNLMRHRSRGDISESRTLGMAGCVAIALLAPHVPALVVAGCLVALLLAVIAVASNVRQGRIS